MGGGPRGVKTKSAAGSKFGRKTKTPPPVKKTVEPVAEVKIEPIKDSKYKQQKASLLEEDAPETSRTILGG
mgnify:CR=1 FL=1